MVQPLYTQHSGRSVCRAFWVGLVEERVDAICVFKWGGRDEKRF